MNQRDPHHPLNQPAEDPDPSEWPDPYDRRPDPLAPAPEHEPEDPARAAPGATSTSEPHPREDPEAIPAEGPKRDRIDR